MTYIQRFRDLAVELEARLETVVKKSLDVALTKEGMKISGSLSSRMMCQRW